MTTIDGKAFFATPLSAEEANFIFTMSWFSHDYAVPYPSGVPGVLIIGPGYSRWIPNSWYDEEKMKQL